MVTATAAEIVETDQPNSARSGSINTPGTARNAAAPTRARNVTAPTHQAGWIRRAGTGSGTARACPTRLRGDSSPPDRVRNVAAGASPDVTGDSSVEGPTGAPVWLSSTYRRRPRSSGAAGVDVGLRLRHRGAPGCPTSR